MIDLFYSYSGMENDELDFSKVLDKYFSLEEQAEYSRFRVIKRQFEWICSRIISKNMIKQILKDEKLNFPDIRIQKEESGQPYIYLTDQGRLEGKFSLSHSNDYVFCGYSTEKDLKFGLDLEKIEERSLDFIQDYFTPREIERYQFLDGNDKFEYTTMVWSAKESVLKTLGLGLSIDTRKVEIIPLEDLSRLIGWNSCSVNLENKMNFIGNVYWQKIDGYIRTICIPEDVPIRLIEILL
jgi:phosphopantetheine--protein transferase-like protein